MYTIHVYVCTLLSLWRWSGRDYHRHRYATLCDEVVMMHGRSLCPHHRLPIQGPTPRKVRGRAPSPSRAGTLQERGGIRMKRGLNRSKANSGYASMRERIDALNAELEELCYV